MVSDLFVGNESGGNNFFVLGLKAIADALKTSGKFSDEDIKSLVKSFDL